MPKYILLIISISLSLSEPAHSSGTYSPNLVYQLAMEKKLASDDQWLKLLHYSDGRSVIKSETFFLSSTGKNDPSSELESTIKGFFQDNTNDNSLHPQCLFPARLLWLQDKLDNRDIFPVVRCIKFEQWKQENNTSSISLVFVTGYLGNPASFFGHLLMKFNSSSSHEDPDSPLLDSSINFGANTGPQDNPLKYVTYGLFGGYNAMMAESQYYSHEYGYAENEQRELWEYKLDLTEDEIDLLVAHLWELKGKKFTYYFLNGNCATQMAKFIEIILNEPILVSFQAWDMPLDIFKSISNIYHDGRPLVKSISKRESKFARIYRKLFSLEKNERLVVKGIVDNIDKLKTDAYRHLSIVEKARILDLLFDYYELISVDGSELEKVVAKQNKRILLLERLSFQPIDIEWDTVETNPPHLAQNPQKLGVSFGYSTEFGAIGTVSIRAAYYDFLALEAARFKNSNATFFDVNIRFSDDKVWLQKFDILNLTTLNILQVDLFEEKKFAWQTRLAVEQQDLSCRSCEAVRWYGGVGKAVQFFDNISIYAIPEVMLDIGNIKDSAIGAGLGLLYTSSENWKTHFKVTPRAGIDNNDILLSWDNRFGNEQDWDIRLNFEHHKASDISLSFSRYF